MKKKLILRLEGGFGNQLFQIAFIFSFYNLDEYDLYYDSSAYDYYKIRNFETEELLLFLRFKKYQNSNIKYRLFKILVASNRFLQYFFRRSKYQDKYQKVLNFLNSFGIYINTSMSYTLYEDKFGADSVFIFGYFQSYKYLSNNIFISRLHEFISKKKFICNVNNDTLVSARVGDDYLINDNLRTTSIFELIEGIDSFDLMSDDLSRCVNTLQSFGVANFNVIPVDDLYHAIFISSCYTNVVISNSSFSWWLAYYAWYFNNSKIILPRLWYKYQPANTELFFVE